MIKIERILKIWKMWNKRKQNMKKVVGEKTQN